MSYSRQNPSPRFVQLIEQYRSMHRDGSPVKGIAASALSEASAARYRGILWDMWADVQCRNASAEARCGNFAPRG